jgi:hypothetical protein
VRGWLPSVRPPPASPGLRGLLRPRAPEDASGVAGGAGTLFEIPCSKLKENPLIRQEAVSSPNSLVGLEAHVFAVVTTPLPGLDVQDGSQRPGSRVRNRDQT